MLAKDTKPYSVSQEVWERLWLDYPNYMQKIYDISQELPGYVGMRYKRIDDEIAQLYLYPEYKAALIHWRNQLLSTTPADSTPKLTPNNITRQIVVCKG
jgi:hypothetical protein